MGGNAARPGGLGPARDLARRPTRNPARSPSLLGCRRCLDRRVGRVCGGTRRAFRPSACGRGWARSCSGALLRAGDVGTKAVVGSAGQLGFVPAVLAAHGLGFILLQLGFQRGSALATAGVATLFTNAVPIAAGMVLYGDGLPAGALGVARLLSFAAVVAGAVLLTRGPGLAVGSVRPAPVSAR